VSIGAAAAYSATGAAWQLGPGRVYDRLAEVVVGRSPVPLTGRRVLDVGAGTGAATRAVTAAGAAGVVAVDAAPGMLAHDADRRPPAVVGDALALPFPHGAFGAAVAAFSLNHVTMPAAGLREMARVTRPGGPLLAAAYAADDTHPVKAAVEAALRAKGWEPEPWSETLRTATAPLLATVDGCAAAARDAGLDVDVEAIRVPFPDLGPRDLVAWRLGMAQHAPFVARLAPGERDAVEADALARLGDAPPLVRSILVLRAVSPSRSGASRSGG
jgi:SAM-dependent methyltransferase